MAKAEKLNAPSLRLELTHSEAIALVAVLSRVGGHHADSDRREIQRILDAVQGAGFFYWKTREDKCLSGSLFFHKTPEGKKDNDRER